MTKKTNLHEELAPPTPEAKRYRIEKKGDHRKDGYTPLGLTPEHNQKKDKDQHVFHKNENLENSKEENKSKTKHVYEDTKQQNNKKPEGKGEGEKQKEEVEQNPKKRNPRTEQTTEQKTAGIETEIRILREGRGKRPQQDENKHPPPRERKPKPGGGQNK